MNKVITDNIGKSKQNMFEWWKSNESDLHENIFDYLKYLDTDQNYVEAENLRNLRLYGNIDSLNVFNQQRNDTQSIQHRVTLNIVQSMVDTVVSKICKNKPRPSFLTSEGDFSQQQRAKKLTKFVEGIFNDSNFYSEARNAFQDACIFGTGAIKIMEDCNNIKVERVLINEIKIDHNESFYGKPRQMHQVKYIHKDILKEMFPSKAASIDAADNKMDANNMFYSVDYNKSSDYMIKVVESWHLSSKKVVDEDGDEVSHDGLHTITIENCTLHSEPWTLQTFPFVFFRWNMRPLGFFGQGISEQLTGLQLEINKILRTIQVSMHLTSVPKVFVEASSKVVEAHLNNKIGGIIRYAGVKPSYESVGSIPNELFMHLDRLYQRAFEVVGISQLSAQSMKPAGLDSGKALREFNDIETERFMAVGQRYEEAFLEAAKIIVGMARSIYEKDPSYAITIKGKSFIEKIKWEDVDMEDDKFMMAVFPTSALSQHPSGRLQEIQELIQAGFISKEHGMKLLNFPDLDGFYNLANSAENDIEYNIEQIITHGNYLAPEPYQNLQLGVQMFQQAYLYYRSQNAPEDKLEMIRRWIEDASDILMRAMAPETQTAESLPAPEPMPMAPTGVDPTIPADILGVPVEGMTEDQILQATENVIGPEATPTAVPESPETSDLLPNVPV